MEQSTHKNHAIVILAALLLLCLAWTASGASSKEAELFESAYEFYLGFQPGKALELFERFLKDYPESSARDSVYFWKAKSLLQLKRNGDARKVFTELLTLFPESPYAKFADKEISSLGGERPHSAGNAAPVEATVVAQAAMQSASPALQAEAACREQLRRSEDSISDLEKHNDEIEKRIGQLEAEATGLAAERDTALRQKEAAEKARDAAGRSAAEEAEKRAAQIAARLKEEMDSKQKNWQELDRLVADLKRDNEALNRLTREKDGRIAELERDAKNSEQERRSLQEKAAEAGALRKELQAARGAAGVDSERAKKESESNAALVAEARRLSAENSALAGKVAECSEKRGLLERARDKAEAGGRAASETLAAERAGHEKSLAEAAAQRDALVLRLKKAEEEKAGLAARADSLSKSSDVCAQALQESADAQAKLKLHQRDIADRDALLASARSAATEKEKALGRLESELRECAAARDAAAREKSDAAKSASAEAAKRDALLKEYVGDRVRIEGRSYSLRDMLLSETAAAAALAKAGAGSCPWRNGDAVLNFISREVLVREALRRGLAADASVVRQRANGAKFDRHEEDFFRSHILIEALVAEKRKEMQPDEKVLREYYEKNRDAFRESEPMPQIKFLSIARSENEMEDGILAVDVRQQALAGTSFEEIQKQKKGAMSVKVMPMSEIPAWIRERIGQLAEGEVSQIFSSGNEYLIASVSRKKASHRRFEDVRAEIASRLRSQEPDDRMLAAWVSELSRDVEILP